MADSADLNTNQQISSVQNEPQAASTNIAVSVQPASIEVLRKEFSNHNYHNPYLNQTSSVTFSVRLSHLPNAEINLSQGNYYLNPDRIYDLNFERKLLQYILAAERASSIYTALNITSSGMQMDQNKIFSLLRNSSMNDIKLINDLYQQQFKRELSLDMRYGLKSDPRLIEHMEVLLKGNKLESYASEVKLLLEQTPQSAKQLGQLLREIDVKEAVHLKDILNTKYSIDLEKELGLKFKSPESELLKLELSKDPVYKQQQVFNELIKTAAYNPEPLIQYLRELTPIQSELLKNLKPDLNQIQDPVVREICRQFLADNKPLAEAFYINRELKSPLPDIIRIDQSISSLNDQDRSALKAVYENKFAVSIDNDIKSAFKNSLPEKTAAVQLLENGKIDETSRIYFLSKGSENNIQHTDNLLKILDTKTYNEMSQIKNEISRIHSISLDSIIANALRSPEHSRVQLDTRIALYGKAETFEDEVSRVRAKYEFERIYLPLKIEKFVDTLLKKGKKADQEMEELEKEHKKLADKKEKVTEEEEIRFYNMLNFLEKSLSDYEKTKRLYNSTVENMIGAFSALTLYIIANDLKCPLIISASLSTAVFFLAKYISRSYIKESIAIEQSLEGFKDRQRRRKKSYFSKRMPRKRI